MGAWCDQFNQNLEPDSTVSDFQFPGDSDQLDLLLSLVEPSLNGILTIDRLTVSSQVKLNFQVKHNFENFNSHFPLL